MLGTGVMIGMLGNDGSGAKTAQAAIGQVITQIALVDDALRLSLADGTTLVIKDDGQSCCERRYMTCDDDLAWYAGRGAILRDLEVRSAPNVATSDDEYPHEVQFLLVTTDKGVITACTHNEHNGYYGGFLVECSIEPAAAHTPSASSSA